MVSQETYDDIKQNYDELEAKYESNLVYINYLQRHLFGKTSERHVPSPVNALQDSLFAPEAPIENVIVEKEQITYERCKKVAVKYIRVVEICSPSHPHGSHESHQRTAAQHKKDSGTNLTAFFIHEFSTTCFHYRKQQ